MTVEEIVKLLSEKYLLEYAPVSGGQWLRRSMSDPIINLSYGDFETALKDPRIVVVREMHQRHPIVHGLVFQYSLKGQP